MRRSLFLRRIKIIIRLFINLIWDIKKGYIFRYSKKRNIEFDPSYSTLISQDLKPNKAKLHNLLKASKSIEEIVILSGEIFSFWKTIGAPTKRNGFLESRSIVGNEIKKSFGGGLCQLSGLIYYISLESGLEIIERHNHSVDIYDENTRFTPLGSDSTLVYGYKDLRIKNNLNSPIKFVFNFEARKLTISLQMKNKVKNKKVRFEKYILDKSSVEIRTIVEGEEIDKSIYKKAIA